MAHLKPGRLAVVANTNGGTEYWAGLAQSLHQLADNLAALGALGVAKPWYASVRLSFDDYAKRFTPEHATAVNAIGDVAGVEAVTQIEGRGKGRRGHHTVVTKLGDLHFTAVCAVEVPPTRRTTMAQLEEENARLRAQLGRPGGAR